MLDYHTGLGPYGYCEILSTADRQSEGHHRARQWFGRSVTSPAGGDSASAVVDGDNASGSTALLPGAKVTAVALEFGITTPDQVVLALRADAWLHGHGDPTSAMAAPIKRRLRDVFHADEDVWKGMVLGQSLLAFRSAVAGLASE